MNNAAAEIGQRQQPRACHVEPDDATAAFRDMVPPQSVGVAVMGDAAALVPALAAVGLAAEVVDLRG